MGDHEETCTFPEKKTCGLGVKKITQITKGVFDYVDFTYDQEPSASFEITCEDECRYKFESDDTQICKPKEGKCGPGKKDYRWTEGPKSQESQGYTEESKKKQEDCTVTCTCNRNDITPPQLYKNIKEEGMEDTFAGMIHVTCKSNNKEVRVECDEKGEKITVHDDCPKMDCMTDKIPKKYLYSIV